MGHHCTSYGAIVRSQRQDRQAVPREVSHSVSRFHNHLDSSIISAEWSTQEEVILYEMHE